MKMSVYEKMDSLWWSVCIPNDRSYFISAELCSDLAPSHFGLLKIFYFD